LREFASLSAGTGTDLQILAGIPGIPFFLTVKCKKDFFRINVSGYKALMLGGDASGYDNSSSGNTVLGGDSSTYGNISSENNILGGDSSTFGKKNSEKISQKIVSGIVI